MLSLEEIIVLFSYGGILVLMTLNGVVSFPSSQVLYIICGYFVFTGQLSLPLVLIAGAIGNTVGNIILYEIVRSKGLKYISRFHLFPEKEILKVQAAFKRRGPLFLFVAKLLPAIKVFAPIPAGLSKMNRVLYTLIILVSSSIWAGAFISIGYFFGKSSDVFGVYAPFLLIVALIVVMVFYRYMNSKEVLQRIEGYKK